MKNVWIRSFWVGMLCLASSVACGQSVSLETPKEVAGMKADAGTSKLIVTSNSDNLTIIHEMGDDKVTKVEEGENLYRYEMVHAMSEDEMEYGGFCKTMITVTLSEGSERFPLVLHAGKCYRGSFNLAGIKCLEDAGGLHPYKGEAKISFSSEFGDLSIWCDGKLFFDKGKPVAASAGVVRAVKGMENNLHAYEFVITLSDDGQAAPKFRVKAQIPDAYALNVNTVEVLEARKSYRYSISKSVETVTRTLTFEEAKAIADKYYAEYASQSESSYFEGAVMAFKEVRAHKDCPVELRDELLRKQNEMAFIRKYSYYVEKARGLKEKAIKEQGYDSDEAYKWLGTEQHFCKMLVDKHPEIQDFKSMLESLEREVYGHSKSMVKQEVVVRHEYPVITGRVTKGEGFIGGVAGVKIYGTNISDGTMRKSKDMDLLGMVSGNGTYEVILKRPYDYLYFYGEKGSRPISYTTQVLNVELTR